VFSDDIRLFDLFPRDSVKISHNVKLADPKFYLPRPIDVLIGARTLFLLLFGQINLSRGDYDLCTTIVVKEMNIQVYFNSFLIGRPTFRKEQ